MVLDFTVPIGGADIRFMALQPGSAMGGWAGHPVLPHTPPVYLLQIPPRYSFKSGLTLAGLTESNDFHSKPNNQRHKDSSLHPNGQRISNLACQHGEW